MDKLYVGIDLGTTNSAVAVFADDRVRVAPNRRGQECTPSIVRISGSAVTVGERARKFLQSDPLHTHREFKRLMGTGKSTAPDAEGRAWLPEQLSAEVLKALLDDVQADLGARPRQAVVTVPALFELPQSKATAEAARLAGLDKIELLPEPVASALAAGWSDADIGQSWLVFDLGGGTFDVSLIESRDGLLRVIGHDGDNFLGGRDIDRVLVDWAARQLSQRRGLPIDIRDPAWAALAALLYAEVEQAKIRLSTQEKTAVEIDLDANGRELVESLELSRAELDALCAPLIERALSICQRLLREHGVADGGLDRVVLVGGPAHMPVIKERVRAELAPLAAENLDPMTLVAQGAALYAATIDFGTEQARADAAPKNGSKFWLQYPTVCSELNPTIIGRVVEAVGGTPARVVLRRQEDHLETTADFNEEGAFIASVPLKPGRGAVFQLEYLDRDGRAMPGEPDKIAIVHGLTLSDPPLSRSVGVALANGYVKVFVERGAALPVRRSFVQSTVDMLTPGSGGSLNIPIVQGERNKARFCRKIGNLVIHANDLKRTLHAGASVEITIEIDRGGNLQAQALIVEQKKLIKGVADLAIPSADPAALHGLCAQLKRRLALLQQEAFRNREDGLIRTLGAHQEAIIGIGNELAGLRNDEDACQRLLRNLMELDSDIEMLESRGQIQALVEEGESKYFNADYVVSQYGSEVERKMLDDCGKRFRAAAELGRASELERAIEQMEKINEAAYRKSPDFWADQFFYTAARVHEAKDIKRATKLVEQGRKSFEQGKREELRGITEALWAIMPGILKSAEQTHDSGVF